MFISQSTVLKEESIYELLVEIERPGKSSDMADRDLVVHQAELPIGHFGEEWKG